LIVAKRDGRRSSAFLPQRGQSGRAAVALVAEKKL
jgi:hypothetical protein